MIAIDVIFLLSEAGQREEARAGRDAIQRVVVPVDPGHPLWARVVELARFSPSGVGQVEIGHADWSPDDGAEPVDVASGVMLTKQVLTYNTKAVDLGELIASEENRREAVAAYEARAAEIRARAEAAAAAKADAARARKRASMLAAIEDGIVELMQLGVDTSALRVELERDGPSQSLSQAVADAVRAETLARAERDRRAWIEQHGSTRLRTCVAEGIECTAAYVDERLAMERPGWCLAPSRMEIGVPRNPPTHATALLEEARATGSGSLRYATIDRARGVVVETGPRERASRFAWTGYVVAGSVEDWSWAGAVIYNVCVAADGRRWSVTDLPR